MKRIPRKMVQIVYSYKGECHSRTGHQEVALDRIESLTRSGAVILKVESFEVVDFYMEVQR